MWHLNGIFKCLHHRLKVSNCLYQYFTSFRNYQMSGLDSRFKLMPRVQMTNKFQVRSASVDINSSRSYSEVNSQSPDTATSSDMVKIFFVLSTGEEVEVTGKVGENVMEVGVENEVGMEGACGGQLACTTCHVYIEEKYESCFEEAVELEEDLLDSAPFNKLNSRLGCQLYLTKELEGARFTLPPGTVNFYVDGRTPTKH